MSLAPAVYPANPMQYWKDKSLSKNYRRKPIKLIFVPLELPPAPAKEATQSWVDRIKKKDDDSERDSDKEDNAQSSDD